ncbi:MAG: AAA family ATPase [Bryobacterales bacterium]|nr:AAA family ATPase [Bryobacterales bacterium]
MLPIRVELLGKLRLICGERLVTSVNTNRLQSLLAFLALHSGAAQSRERLASVLWPESNDSQARTNLRQLLHNLRRALPVECSPLTTDNRTVCWRRDIACSIDVIEFETVAARAADAERRGDFTTAREALEEAARLYQEDLLPDLYDEWVQDRREELRQQLVEVLASLSTLVEAAGDYPAAIRHASRLVAADPLREPSYQMLMRLHVRNHDRSSALRVYHQCMRILRRELGVSPCRETQDLYARVLNSGPLPAPHVEPPPYTGAAPTRMVGRTEEWERLIRCWRRVTQGETHFALILGEPGIGKSRLAEELLRYCPRSPEGAAARARCYLAQGRLAYGPVAECLRAEPMQSGRVDLPRPQLAELSRVLPEILVERPEISPPPPLTETWQRRHLYEALNACFGKGPKPLLLLIEDLQWCDPDTFEWLHSFFRSNDSGRTLVVGTARPEETGREHPLADLVGELRLSGLVSEFPLAPLSIEESAALAAQVAGRECDPAFLARLNQAAKGNPLFVVESVRASLEDQASQTSVPPRVQAVIAARIAQLSPPAYELAGLAAAIGRPFSFDLLAKATDWDEDSLSRALEELWQRRIINGLDAGAYDYSHDLLRDVAYSELNPVRRRSWHRRIARALEELHAPALESVSGSLAAHYEAAGLVEQAIRNYRVAASVARHRFADRETADLIRRALRLCRDLPETAKRDREELELLVTLGPSLVATHGFGAPEVGETYERGLSLARRSGDRKHFFPLLSGAWAFHVTRGELEESRRLGQLCVSGPSGEPTPALEMAGHALLGFSLFHLGQLIHSQQHLEQAASLCGSLSDPALALFVGPDFRVLCSAYSSLVFCLLGDDRQAVLKSEEAVALAREVSHPFSLAMALACAAKQYVLRHESALARARAEEAYAVSEKHGFAYYLACAWIMTGWATAVEGDTAAGLVKLRHGLDALQSTGAEIRLPFYYGLLAEACGLAGEAGEALANIANGFAFQSKNGETWFAPELHRVQGDVLLHSGNPAQARISYGRAIEMARQTGAHLLELRAAARLRDLPAVRRASENAS